MQFCDTQAQHPTRHSLMGLCRHGEYSGKDYEATFSRLVMVKPLARHLASYPNIYEVDTTCAEVRARAHC